MFEVLNAANALQIIQKVLGAVAIGLGGYTVNFYNTWYALGESWDEKIALFGAGFCIFSVTTPLAPTTVSILSDLAIGSVRHITSLYTQGGRRWFHDVYVGALLRTHGCREWTTCE